jgi:hypothetical protein
LNLHEEYRQFGLATFANMRASGLLIEAEIARESPNAEATGRLYSQIEGHRRILAERSGVLRRDLAALLSPAQRTLIEELDRAGELLALAFRANSLSLLPPEADSRPSSMATRPGSFLLREITSGGEPLPGARTVSTIFRGCGGGPDFYFGFGGGPGFAAPRELRK